MHQINGKTIELLKNDDEMLEELQNKFNQNNQAFGVWSAIEESIEQLPTTATSH